jgi:hypothetical protein
MMTATMKLRMRDVKRAFNAEAGTLRNGEHSHFLPGFTGLEITSAYVTGLDEWKVYYTATRIRDGKVYGVALNDNLYGVDHFRDWGNPNVHIVFTEMVRKTYEVVYYEPAK